MNWSVLFVVREGPLRRRFVAPIGEEREREVSKVMKNRRDRFSCEFREFKGSYKVLGYYRECHGTMDGL